MVNPPSHPKKVALHCPILVYIIYYNIILQYHIYYIIIKQQ